NVTFVYPNGHSAIEDVDIELDKGESVAIIGQNGAGKTTLAKMMNGLLRPTEGNVIINERNTKDYTTAQISNEVGYVFQNPDDQIFNESVYSEIEFGPKNLKLDTEEIDERVNKAAEIVGIKDLLEENPQNL